MKTNAARPTKHNRHPGKSRDPYHVSTGSYGANALSSMDSGFRRNDDNIGNVSNPGQDRLAHAQIFANELNESRLWKIKISYQKRWTARRRAQKAVEIQITKPWRRSTGPKTDAGKARARLNALHPDAGYHAMKDALLLHSNFLRTVRLLTRMLKNKHPDAKTLGAHCHNLGLFAANALRNALSLSERDFPSTHKFPA